MAQTVTPLPSLGEVFAGQDVAGRELRVSGHPDSDRMVLSIWQSGRCLATVRLARADVPGLTHALVAGLVPVPESPAADPDHGTRGTLHELHPTVTAADTLRDLGARIGSTFSELGTRLRRFGPRD
jgi:hypothetical protein